MHFSRTGRTSRSYTVRLWIKQTSAQGSNVELLELPSVLKLSINNVANQFDVVWHTNTCTMQPQTGISIVGTWIKIALVDDGDFLQRTMYLGTKSGCVFSDTTLALVTFSDLYLFGFATASASPKFQGYIRDVAVLPSALDSVSPSDFLTVDSYKEHGKKCAFFYIRMDEQFTKVLLDHANMVVLPMTAAMSFVDDSTAPLLCPAGTTYNPATGVCEGILLYPMTLTN